MYIIIHSKAINHLLEENAGVASQSFVLNISDLIVFCSDLKDALLKGNVGDYTIINIGL